MSDIYRDMAEDLKFHCESSQCYEVDENDRSFDCCQFYEFDEETWDYENGRCRIACPAEWSV